MESEVSYAKTNPRTENLCGVQVLYGCEGCGREYVWTKGEPGLHPTSDYDEAPEPAWREES